MKTQRPFPQAIVTKKAARAIHEGHPWVFAGEVKNVEPAPLDGRVVENGGIVDVREENGTYLGTGLISENSTIRIRLVTRNANDRLDEAFWRRKLTWAWEHRKACMGSRVLPGCEPDTNCCRIVFSEADGLPGLIVDRYEDVLVAQVGTVGMERIKPMLYELLLDILQADGQQVQRVYERNDMPARDKEGLPRHSGWWKGEGSAQLEVRENGIVFGLDIEQSQKTGFFLDQKYNRRAVREIAAGRRVLDCFSHVGPFGLNAAAGGAAFVRCVDSSATALGLARENAKLNGFDDRMGFTQADVLEYLPELLADKARLREEGGPFDLIVLDPPAFAKTRKATHGAMRGYRDINYRAMRLLPRGGYLATCSCSHFMTTDLLKKAIYQAAHDASVQLMQVEERQQAPDHPILWGVPETHYLDFFIFRVV